MIKEIATGVGRGSANAALAAATTPAAPPVSGANSAWAGAVSANSAPDAAASVSA